MNRLMRYKNHGRRQYICRVCDNDLAVREGLAYSPSDMARLTERGMPVNSLMANKAIIEGEDNPCFDVTSDRKRFVDVCDLWEEHQTILEKARQASKKSKLAKANES